MVFIITFCGLHAADPANTAQASYYKPEFQLMENGMYSSLGLGSRETMLCFLSNQIKLIKVNFYDASGVSGSSISDVPLYTFNPLEETLEEARIRIANKEFGRLLQDTGWSPNQKFKLAFRFLSITEAMVFFTAQSSFTAIPSGSAYTVPENAVNAEPLQLASYPGDASAIAWPGIRRATLVVFDRDGKLIYNGDSKSNAYLDTNMAVIEGFDLHIARRFLTNGCTGVLNVFIVNRDSGKEISEAYDLSHGRYPYTARPLISLDVRKPNPVLKISGGLPGILMNLQVFSDLSSEPLQIPITFDNVGLACWTNMSKVPIQFFNFGPDTAAAARKKP